MSNLNSTPSANRVHIAFFGKRNSGKSSLVNVLANQEVSIVSDVLGTTTDPVSKSVEIFPIGPCTLIDTAGFDDEGELGKLRIEKTLNVINKTDIALVVIPSDEKDFGLYNEWIEKIAERKIPILCVINKIDLNSDTKQIEDIVKRNNIEFVKVSSIEKINIDKFLQKIIEISPTGKDEVTITGKLACEGDSVLLVAPQDSEAPKGRLILPQVQTIRELLDKNCVVTIVTDEKIKEALEKLQEAPKLIICDSKVFKKVYELAPKESILTSFSILFANYKGDIKEYEKGADAIDNLNENSTVLIAESCSHTTLDGDIATVKIPNMLRKKAGENIKIEYCKGNDFKLDKKYDLVIHCGGCMVTRGQILSRIKMCKDRGIPITNYGIAIAKMTGILKMVRLHNDK
ncbi:MAG: [FeFe] hydrogenase H-cluster maturation GTPase HydF [Ruminococcaceae bacterium]|nr:[FeFe] hydrogenase H-cluster maturation GTPase HydF [Oscillospiraceae bacterium]